MSTEKVLRKTHADLSGVAFEVNVALTRRRLYKSLHLGWAERLRKIAEELDSAFEDQQNTGGGHGDDGGGRREGPTRGAGDGDGEPRKKRRRKVADL